jgi:hypothetical protein
VYTLIESEGRVKRVLYAGRNKQEFEQAIYRQQMPYHLEKTERIVTQAPDGVVSETITTVLKVGR